MEPRKKKYSKGKKRGRNYINLTEKSTNCSHSVKVNHVETILERRREAKRSGEVIPDFLELIYQIRSHCIVMAYFPEGSKYHESFGDYNDHPGWKDQIGPNERKLLFSFKKAADAIKKDPKKTSFFDQIDNSFGEYRHLRWLEKVRLEEDNKF